MLLNSTRISSALRMAAGVLVAFSFLQLPAPQATAATRGSSAVLSPYSDPQVLYLGVGETLGFVHGETIRITVSNPDQPQSRTSDGRKFKMLVAPLILDAQGSVLAQSDEIEIETGQFRSFNFNRDDLHLVGEPGKGGRLQVRAQIRYRFFSTVDRTQITPNEFLNTLEVIDNATGQTRVVHSRPIEPRIQERVIDF
jgi:hypothetical protein